MTTSGQPPAGRPQESGAAALPSIVVTGASGLVGSHFINAVRDRFRIYAVARRSQADAGIPVHRNVRWCRCDIGDEPSVARLFDTLAAEGPIDYVFHFAGYYDFDYRDSPEYRRTNVTGTGHVLAGCARLRPKRFIFSSSLAVSDHLDRRRVLDERTPPDGDYPYARSKREAEALVAAASAQFPCTIARLAAIYSDWCEYGPLYVLLKAWFGGGPLSRVVGGRGETALPYLHICDLNAFWLSVVENHERLGRLDFLAASPNGCTSHNELYRAAAQSHGEKRKAVHVPVPLATVGVALRRFLGVCLLNPPFERPWMMRYVDSKMRVDARRTHALLRWAPKPRFHVMRRVLFLIEIMKRDPAAWTQRNVVMTKRSIPPQPGLKIYNAMVDLRPRLVEEHAAYLTGAGNRALYPGYQRLDPRELRLRTELMFQLLESSVRLGDRHAILTYANHLARLRFIEGIRLEELSGSLEYLTQLVIAGLGRYPGLERLQWKIHLEIGLSMQLVLDEIEDAYETLAAQEATAGAAADPPHAVSAALVDRGPETAPCCPETVEADA